MFQLSVSPAAFLRVKAKTALPCFMASLRSASEALRALLISSKAAEAGNLSVVAKSQSSDVLKSLALHWAHVMRRNQISGSQLKGAASESTAATARGVKSVPFLRDIVAVVFWELTIVRKVAREAKQMGVSRETFGDGGNWEVEGNHGGPGTAYYKKRSPVAKHGIFM